jgi:hypothetical protein
VPAAKISHSSNQEKENKRKKEKGSQISSLAIAALLTFTLREYLISCPCLCIW